MSPVSQIKDKVNAKCLVKCIRTGRLWIDLQHETRYLVIDFDREESPLGPGCQRPDFLFVGDLDGIRKKGHPDPGRLVPIEVSEGNSKSLEHIRKQLQAAADWAHDKLEGTLRPTLVPVYLGKVDKHIKVKLRKQKFAVCFRGQNEVIKITRTGRQLPAAK